MATTKLIRFNDDEESTILQYAEKYGRNFSAYVKELIIKDMENKPTLDREELKQLIQDILKENGVNNPIQEQEMDEYETALNEMLGI